MLIIVESAGKKSSIEKYTCAKVIATFGHFKHLPERSLGINLNTFDPTFTANKERQLQVLKKLKHAARGEEVVIATDQDIEGEAIGVMVYQEIKAIAKSIKRAYFGEITKTAVLRGIRDATLFEKCNMHIYDVFLGRLVADRLVGYFMTSIANAQSGWHLKEADRLTVGRVQTAGLMLIVGREREIKNFIPVDYFILKADLNPALPFTATHVSERFDTKSDAQIVLSKIAGASSAKIIHVEKREALSDPQAPFITSTLLIEAFQRLHLSAQQTMTLAQRLYEGFGDGGYITYMKTDSAMLSDDFMQHCGDYIRGIMPDSYDAPHQFETKSSITKAHEGIRPAKSLSNIEADMKSIVQGMLKAGYNEFESNKAAELYTMIAMRSIASQMRPAKFVHTIYKILINGVLFIAKGSVLTDPGYKAVFDDVEKGAEPKIPEFKVGDVVEVDKFYIDEKQTPPPARFDEPSLIAKLEKDGIGRPFTYVTIINMLSNRNYATVEERFFVPTEKAEVLVQFLEQHYPFMVDLKCIAAMESFLDDVASGSKNWKELQRDLYEKMGRPVPGGASFISPKQLQYAEALAKQTGNELSDEMRNNKKLLSKFIDANRGKTSTMKTVVLSEKQLIVVENNAPDEIKALLDSDPRKVAEWIDGYFKELYGDKASNNKSSSPKTSAIKKEKAS